MEPKLYNASESRTLRGTGLHAIGRIFGQAALDYFFARGVFLVVCHKSGSTSVLMDCWNKWGKTSDSSLAAYLEARLERPFSHISVAATAHKFMFNLGFARLSRSCDLFKLLRALHARAFGNVIFSGATLHTPAIQPRWRQFRLLSCAMVHEASLKILMI